MIPPAPTRMVRVAEATWHPPARRWRPRPRRACCGARRTSGGGSPRSRRAGRGPPSWPVPGRRRSPRARGARSRTEWSMSGGPPRRLSRDERREPVTRTGPIASPRRAPRRRGANLCPRPRSGGRARPRGVRRRLGGARHERGRGSGPPRRRPGPPTCPRARRSPGPWTERRCSWRGSAARVHAVGATCTHLGGPLGEGVLLGGEGPLPLAPCALRAGHGRGGRRAGLRPAALLRGRGERAGRVFVTGRRPRPRAAPAPRPSRLRGW